MFYDAIISLAVLREVNMHGSVVQWNNESKIFIWRVRNSGILCLIAQIVNTVEYCMLLFFVYKLTC